MENYSVLKDFLAIDVKFTSFITRSKQKIKPAKQKLKSNIIMKVMAILIINCPICLKGHIPTIALTRFGAIQRDMRCSVSQSVVKYYSEMWCAAIN